ncbi:hypothetical protein [Pectobacterium polaris]|uniref:hypothetical protein n=1 Tax=Pectobacterium polaris TaxID=2042057 RepID=UPI00158177B1|nr:hypothetical protein [Pectobacterium polaris]
MDRVLQEQLVNALNALTTSHKELQFKVLQLETISDIDEMVIMALFADCSAEDRLKIWDQAVTDMYSEHAIRALNQNNEIKEKAKVVVDIQAARIKHWTTVFRAAAGKE